MTEIDTDTEGERERDTYTQFLKKIFLHTKAYIYIYI